MYNPYLINDPLTVIEIRNENLAMSITKGSWGIQL